ncbi:MAG: lytic transglycosylase domain-containing protein [Clostridia bacterium]|nr:lytic transglycosylase domain-containing protein [Clostridia bacterium]
MNTPTPAPHRRRRIQSDPDTQQESIQPARREAMRRTPQAAPDARQDVLQMTRRPAHTGSASARRAAIHKGRIAAVIRCILIFLCLAVFFFCALHITKDYLARQEERRRLEAEAAEKAQHPLIYADLIVANSLQQGLDPALVAAVILRESSYNPEAVSYAGARGLMQLMEDTAQWVAHKLDEDDASYSFDNLFDPETNIRYGTWYLGYLSRRFDGDEKKIVCAYHAGQGNVDSWLKNPAYSSDGVTLDVIPTEDTAAYAGRVLKARSVYQKYYFPGPTPAPTDTP